MVVPGLAREVHSVDDPQEGSLDAAEIADDLKRVADQLGARVAEFHRPEVTEPLDRLGEAATQAQQASSGSWFGYHSRVYYRDLQPPPAGAVFSSEWGFMTAFSNPTRGDWVELSYDDAVQAIEELAGNPDLSHADRAADAARSIVDENQADVVSLLTASLQGRDDEFLAALLDEAKTLSPLSHEQVIRGLMPGQVMTRDFAAYGQGIQTPPHHAVMARVISTRDAIRACSELEKVARRGANHLERVTGTAHPEPQGGDRIFIGHGGSPLWRELKDFLQDRLGLAWDEFNRVPVAGVTNIARLAEMLDASGIAFLVLTAEDEDQDGSVHARQNVIHEAGLFQGRLGFSRAIVLLEEGCDEFTNIQGLGQIRFPRGNISACFEEVRRVLEREGFIEEGS